MKERKLQGYFNTMLFRDLIEHYRVSNPEMVRYFLKRVMANLTKPTSINSIYNDLKSQGLKISKDKLYELADHICSIFLFFRVPKYDKSIIKEIDGLLEASQVTGCTNLWIITNDEEGEITENEMSIKVVPAWKWLLRENF